jgi:C4-dicarboxylate-binding protein DctP
MTSNKQPLRKPEDFKGQRFRIMPSMIIEEQFRILGAEPIVVPFNQVYYALEKNQFEGQENTISNIYSKRLYQLQRYMTISNHGYLGYAVLVNEGFWNGLPEDIRAQVAEAMQETTHWILKESERMNEQQLAEIQENSNIEVHYLTDQEKSVWKQKLQSIYETFRREADPKLVKQIEYLGR